jgi:C1A family cysteine protease
MESIVYAILVMLLMGVMIYCICLGRKTRPQELFCSDCGNIEAPNNCSGDVIDNCVRDSNHIQIHKKDREDKEDKTFFLEQFGAGAPAPLRRLSLGTPAPSRHSNTILTTVGKVATNFDQLPLPDSVNDTFTEWIDRGFVQTAKDQMSCGGCWAFATCHSLGSSIRIATNGKWNPPQGLSEQFLISCGNKLGVKYSSGCDGAIPYYAFEAIRDNGIPLDRQDITSPQGITYYQTVPDSNRSCRLNRGENTCRCETVTETMKTKQGFASSIKIDPETKYRTVGEPVSLVRHNDGPINKYQSLKLWPDIPKHVIAKNVVRMKKAIYYNGPITCGYQVTTDFNNFIPKANNYYKYDGSSPMEYGHAVVIVGWTKVGSVPVWICQNSWGEKWGYGFASPVVEGTQTPKYKGGFWNHAMGTNENYIESNSSTAFPDLSVPELKPLLPMGVPEDYYKTKTVREIYEGFRASEIGAHIDVTSQTTDNKAPVAVAPTEQDISSQELPPPQTPISKEMKKVKIETSVDISKKFMLIDILNKHLTAATLTNFLNDPTSICFIAATSINVLNVITAIIPTRIDPTFGDSNFSTILQSIKFSIGQQYFSLCIKSASKNYFASGILGVDNDKFSIGKTSSVKVAVDELSKSTSKEGVDHVRLLKAYSSTRGLPGHRCECIDNNCRCVPT